MTTMFAAKINKLAFTVINELLIIYHTAAFRHLRDGLVCKLLLLDDLSSEAKPDNDIGNPLFKASFRRSTRSISEKLGSACRH